LRIFSSATFPTVDSSATALSAACDLNRTVSGPPVARQSRFDHRVYTCDHPWHRAWS